MGQNKKPLVLKDERESDLEITWDVFKAKSLEEQYEILMGDISENNWKDIQDRPAQTPLYYTLTFKDISGYSQDCFFCDDRYCRGTCPVPFTDEVTFNSILEKAGLDDNNNFYDGFNLKDVQLIATWTSRSEIQALHQLNFCDDFKPDKKPSINQEDEEEKKGG